MNKKSVLAILLFCVIVAVGFYIFKSSNFKKIDNINNNSNYNIMILPDSFSNYNSKFIYFDLDAFLDTIPYNIEKYDYLKVAFAIQGLVNRQKPILFYKYQKGGLNKTADDFWLEELRESNNIFSGYKVETYKSFYDVINLAKNLGVINGVVLWDNDVPATSNVASTIAGIENLIPIRYDISSMSCYTDLVVKRNLLGSVKKNLVNKFTNISYLPDANLNSMASGTASTRSSKNDAYLWAKKYYLDTGKTNKTIMAYSRDAWAPKCGDSVCVVGGKLPTGMSPGSEMEVTLTLLNNTQETWTREGNYRIAARSTSGGNNNFQITYGEFGYEQGDNVNEARLYLSSANPVSPGDRVTVKFKIKAPSSTGTYRLSLGVVHDGVGWLSGGLIHNILVMYDLKSSGLFNVYPNYKGNQNMSNETELFSTQLNSSDYLIMNKAFFFELSPDEKVTPIDDRNQKVGEDVRTFKSLLSQQSKNNNGNLFTVIGFVPWFIKYTAGSDPGNSTLSDVGAENKMVELLSSYGAQKDADAYQPCGLTNASIYTYVKLNTPLKQKNDKDNIMSGKIIKEIYDPNTIYFSFYMGDYDSGAWTSSILPSKFKSSGSEYKYPLAWPIDSDLSKRVPHVYNYLYANQNRNDYFVAGDNGTGYLNPMITNNLSIWRDHNIEMNKKFDIDITGLLIGGSRGITLGVQNEYAKMSPVLVGYWGGNSVAQAKVGNTPFISVYGGEQYDNNLANTIYANLKSSAVLKSKFVIIRTVQTSREEAYSVIDKLYSLAKQEGRKIKIVDPYTLAYLYNNHPTNYKGCYSNGTSYKWIDGNSIPSGYQYVSGIDNSSSCKAKPLSVKGDVDGDGKVLTNDYILVKRHMLKMKLLTGTEKEKADVNGDQNIDSLDYIIIKKIILEKR